MTLTGLGFKASCGVSILFPKPTLGVERPSVSWRGPYPRLARDEGPHGAAASASGTLGARDRDPKGSAGHAGLLVATSA